MSATHPLRGLALVVAGSVLLGTTGLWVHALRDLPFPALLAYRFLFAVLGFLLVAAVSPRWRRAFAAPRRAWRALALLGVALAATDGFYYVAIPRVGVGLGSVLLYTAPLFVALFATLFLRERPTRVTLAGIAAGFAGVVLVVDPSPGGAAPLGIAAGLAAGAAWAAWLVASRTAGAHGVSGDAQSALSHAFAFLVVAPVGWGLAPVVPAPAHLGLLAGLGVIAAAFALLLVAQGLRHVDASRAAVAGYVEPLTAVALGALLLGERYGAQEAAGSVLVIAGTLLVTFARTAPRPGDVRPAR